MTTPLTLLPEEMRGQMPPITPDEGVFIAGGSVRRWFSGQEDLQDIDVFAINQETLDRFREEWFGKDVPVHTSKMASTYLYNDEGEEHRVQLINHFCPTPYDLMDSFDFNVCQFAWTVGQIYSSKEALLGITHKHLRVNKITPAFTMDSMRRAFKYAKKGFEPCHGTLRDIAQAVQLLTPDLMERQVSMSPGGGLRINRFD